MHYDIALIVASIALSLAWMYSHSQRALVALAETNRYWLRRSSKSGDIEFQTEASGMDPRVVNELCRHKPGGDADDQVTAGTN